VNPEYLYWQWYVLFSNNLHTCLLTETQPEGIYYALNALHGTVRHLEYDNFVLGAIPTLQVTDLFQESAIAGQPLNVHRAVVKVHSHLFLIYGFCQPNLPPNHLLSSIKPSSVWRGELVIFLIKKRRSLNAVTTPIRIRRSIRKKAIQL